jgi:hypothetical protein
MSTNESTEAPLPVVKNPGVYLAMPAYGGIIHAPFAGCMMKLTQIPNFIAQIEFLNGDSLVNRARNKLADYFLKGRPNMTADGQKVNVLYDWLMFIDTDLIFNPADALKLFEYAKAHGPNIYCGAYPLKTLKPRVVFNSMPGATVDADGMLEVREAGTGFMLIHREVFERMIAAFAEEIEYEADSGNLCKSREIQHDFFTVGVRKDPILGYRRFLSEDWYFCQRWREIGGKVLLHTRINCAHIGQFTYPAKPEEIIEVAETMKKAIADKQKRDAMAPVPALAVAGGPQDGED